VRSSVALALLLAEGIGDTVRVSLSADPVEEIWVARQLLRALGLRREGLELVSCPRCGRSGVDVYGTAERVERRLRGVREPISVAVMGCEVNGPGEASAADVGIAGARGGWLFFRAGQKLRRIESTEEAEETLVEAALAIAAARRAPRD
jgi:(E)-4-hydroxy-3-methylbut-2-enyl-diphosphate synthase